MKRAKIMLTTILLILTVILTVLIILPQKMSATTVELGAIGYYKGIPACYCGDGEDCACIRDDGNRYIIKLSMIPVDRFLITILN